MIKPNTPIVVVAYNRDHCLSRILNSLLAANYKGFSNITLIISIDKHSDNQKVLNVAEEFKWSNGEKIIHYQDTNLGLRNHIIQCGDLALTYGSVIILEDDLFVSPSFYQYAIQALNFSYGEDYIGGISLYNHQLNGQTLTNFSPIADGYDNWYLQFSASWGQAWTKKQWASFKTWYVHNQTLEAKPSIPMNVAYWNNESWLKFHIAYLIETNKYFLYPKIALSSNFGEAGTHNRESSSAYQVDLRYDYQRPFKFSKLNESNSVYDAFYENANLTKYLKIRSSECCVNLNGYKPFPKQKKFMLTTNKLSYSIIKSYGLNLRPIDLNVVFSIPGEDIYLYDLTIEKINKFPKNHYNLLSYNYKIITFSDSIYLTFRITLKRMKNLMRKLNKNS